MSGQCSEAQNGIGYLFIYFIKKPGAHSCIYYYILFILAKVNYRDPRGVPVKDTVAGRLPLQLPNPLRTTLP